MKSIEKVRKQIKDIESIIEDREANDLPTEAIYPILHSLKEEEKHMMAEIEAEKVSVEEVDAEASPFRGDPRQTLKTCLVECAKATKNTGLDTVGHCSGCDCHCRVVQLDHGPNRVMIEHDGVWIICHLTKDLSF